MAFPNFFLLVLLALISGCLACNTDMDCSLNGICSRWKRECVCDSGWKGDDCGVLDLRPAKRGGGYNRTSEGISSWGAKIIQDPKDPDLWHTFIAEFTHNCGLDFWSPYSRIIRAESHSGPEGPFTFAQGIVPAFAHNPTVVYSEAEGKYLMYYIGCPQRDLNETCTSPQFSCGPGNYLNGESGISVMESEDLRHWGKWERVLEGEDEDKMKWNADVTNPSPWPLCTQRQRRWWSWWRRHECQDGGILLAYRGCPFNCSGAEQISLAHASHPSGPYTRLKNDQPIFTSPGGAEDPFLWRDKRGNYHILMHSLEPDGGFGGGPKVGRHAFSRTIGGPWVFNGKTLGFSTRVEFDDGTEVEFYRRERPQLVFSGDGEMRPVVLTTGVQQVGSGMSYTVVVPVGEREEDWRFG